MKIVYCHQYFKTPSMSGGTRSYEMARRLVAKGHEVHVVTSWQGETAKESWFEEKVDGIHVHWLPVPYSNDMTYAQRIKAFFRFAMLSGSRAVAIGGDVVFATSTPLTIAIPGVRAAKKLKVPMVFEVRDLWPELPIAMGALQSPFTIYLARKLERFAYRNSSRIIALSPGMADGVVKTGYPRDKVTEIPNSSDVALFGPENRVREEGFFASLLKKTCKRVVLYPGTLGHINDVRYLVDLAAQVGGSGGDVDFVVIGDGVEKGKIKQRAKELGVWGVNFHMFAGMPKTRLVSAFAEADMIASLFLPLKEMEPNSANKFFDALASATPVMINYGGWQKAIIEEQGCGLVLNRDLESSSKSLVAFLNDAEALESASEAAYGLASERFSRDRLAEQFEQVLVDAVAEFEKDEVS
ncbi:glycosyltransferase family 4 protein [uncultured Spongiibacter sp.]|uniref:glycosyltransferase family 4 protein n=1 Tax=uncultured Spongiibacter sp. TaxID=870896 RepID=UPI002597FB28|nr:glycosyltransferase family 4 protein [uncultured Spongiibacter sp.]